MRSRLVALLSALALVGFVNSTHPVLSAPSHAFEPGCPIPYASIAKHRPIDDACNRFGESASHEPSTQKHRDSNAAKNNLCATGPGIPMTIADFRSLMDAVKDREIKHGSGRLPDDRSELQDLIKKE